MQKYNLNIQFLMRSLDWEMNLERFVSKSYNLLRDIFNIRLTLTEKLVSDKGWKWIISLTCS